MKEITDKLLDELLEKVCAAEIVSDEGFIENKKANRDVANKFLTVSVLIHDIKVHLIYHAKDVINHPKYNI